MYKGNKIGVIIAAAGNGSRMGRLLPKQFINIEGEPMLAKTYKAIANSDIVDSIFVVIKEEHDVYWRELVIPHLDNAHLDKLGGLLYGGDERQESIYKALISIENKATGLEYIMIHDGARPFIDQKTLERVASATIEYGAAIPYVKPKDTVRNNERTLDRNELMLVQTPQGFKLQLILKAYKVAYMQNIIGTDDGSLAEHIGVLPTMVRGSDYNIKITTPSDIKDDFRIGKGYDVHRLIEGRRCILGGVCIPSEKGLLGHSDADVLIHAVMDSLLGAASLGDIGHHFPDTEERYRGISSIKLLEEVKDLIEKYGFKVGNIDATVICEEPKIAPFISEMIINISNSLQIEARRVNIKATTTEKLGFIGRGEGIAAEAICILKTN